jgi:hypothetical protein
MGANIGSGFAKSYATILVSRVFVGVGSSAALAISAATVSWFLQVQLPYLTLRRFVICSFKENAESSWDSMPWP